MNNLKRVVRLILKKPIGIFSKFNPIFRLTINHGITVFVYHDVTDNPSQFAVDYDLSISKAQFKHQIQWISNNFNVIHPGDILLDKSLPQRAAVISFDDGFLGSFENGLAILKEFGIPSVFFLNMHAILEQKPILSAVACYLERYVPEFYYFARSRGISTPFHITISPSILRDYESYYGPLDRDEIINYQGSFANLDVVKKWNNKDLVVYGNHLFEHWNAPVLTLVEFEEQYKKNEMALSKIINSVNLFSFTNGQPGTCFSRREVDLLSHLGAGKIFSTVVGVNRHRNNFILGRIGLNGNDHTENDFWYRIGWSNIRLSLH